jgi:hypothetical protein
VLSNTVANGEVLSWFDGIVEGRARQNLDEQVLCTRVSEACLRDKVHPLYHRDGPMVRVKAFSGEGFLPQIRTTRRVPLLLGLPAAGKAADSPTYLPGSSAL